MLLNESISVAGDVSICVTDKDGVVKDNREMHNLVVTYGKNHIAARLAGIFTGEGAAMSHIGFGTSTIAPIITDTDLYAYLGARVPISLTHTAGTNSVTATASYIGSAGSIAEAGIFNSLTGNTMICRTTFGAISILSTDTLAISWTLKIN